MAGTGCRAWACRLQALPPPVVGRGRGWGGAPSTSSAVLCPAPGNRPPLSGPLTPGLVAGAVLADLCPHYPVCHPSFSLPICFTSSSLAHFVGRPWCRHAPRQDSGLCHSPCHPLSPQTLHPHPRAPCHPPYRPQGLCSRCPLVWRPHCRPKSRLECQWSPRASLSSEGVSWVRPELLSVPSRQEHTEGSHPVTFIHSSLHPSSSNCSLVLTRCYRPWQSRTSRIFPVVSDRSPGSAWPKPEDSLLTDRHVSFGRG